MSASILSDEVLFETKVQCLFILNQYNKPANTEERLRKNELNQSYKLEIMKADKLEDIKQLLEDFKAKIETKKEGLLFQKVEACLDIPNIRNLDLASIGAKRVMFRETDDLLPLKLNACIPLLAYSLGHPEHPVKGLINNIRLSKNLELISSLITEFKSMHVKPRGVFSSMFSRDELSERLDKSSEILAEYEATVTQHHKIK